MRLLHVCRFSLVALVAVAAICGMSQFATAQTTTQGTTTGDLIGGVAIDAEGVLRREVVTDQTGALIRDRQTAARAALNTKVAQPSKLRKVSLNRLEAAIKANQGRPTEEMRYLAGLTRVQYVFFYPETKDIVIAGPAEGWFVDPFQRVCGLDSGRPTVELQDLIVALRSFPPGAKSNKFIGCSIDPTKEGLANLQAYLRSVGSSIGRDADASVIAEGVRSSLGQQNIRIDGIAGNTHFAQVMVEADYRMKLIGIGLERPPIKLASYVDLERSGGSNALQRWYFMPEYQCVRVSDDKLAMQLVGDGVKVVGESELVAETGNRQQTGTMSKATQLFTQGFTKKFPELASKSPVYAQLRNLIDLVVAAAFIQQNDYYAMADWKMELLGDEKAISVETVNAPKHVDAAVNALWRGSRLVTPVGGGVAIKPLRALDSKNVMDDEGGKVSQVREKNDLKNLAGGQWWWD